MNPLLLLLFLASVLNVVVAAPAVSSVHVSFVSGNKATQYSHGSAGDGNLVQYNVVDKLMGVEDHTVRKRSVTRRPPRDPGRMNKFRGRATEPTPTANEPSFTTILTPTTTTLVYTDITTDKETSTVPTSATLALGNPKKSQRKSVRFIVGPSPASSKTISRETSTDKHTVMTGARLDSELHGTSDDTLKPKDTKAVKRSPYLGNNFVGSFNFPDFDEFGGNDFGSLRNFGSGNNGAGSHRASYTAHNPEALAPEGVFTPPIPTEASHYVENDPYLADPDTAKYAAKHPPFFSEFPHKRTVLALNERREENGLEPNILRSIRPFFPFFEINKR